MTDPIADMLSRIRNASAVGKNEVVLPMSKTKLNIAKILESDGWVTKVGIVKVKSKKNGNAMFDQLKITLKYKDNKPAINTLNKKRRTLKWTKVIIHITIITPAEILYTVSKTSLLFMLLSM